MLKNWVESLKKTFKKKKPFDFHSLKNYWVEVGPRLKEKLNH